jgi:hypothetical protein
MTKDSEPPEGGREDDEYVPSDVDIFAMTVRHGAEHAKRHYDRLDLIAGHPDAERWDRLASDLPAKPQAEVLPFVPKEPKP